MMKQGKIAAIVVGADRIAANGDVANKIGTYTVAVLAKEHGIPFYVAAPISTVDLDTPDGSKIPIEQRNPREVTHIAGKQMVPDGVAVENPAFDVTPARVRRGDHYRARHCPRPVRRIAAPTGASERRSDEDVAVETQLAASPVVERTLLIVVIPRSESDEESVVLLGFDRLLIPRSPDSLPGNSSGLAAVSC